MSKKCLDCGEVISGRTDKKFCSDMCRNAYHNRFHGYRNALIRHVNHKLRRNRQILFEMSRSKDEELSKDQLLYNGFDWQFFTEELVVESYIHRFCYDLGIEIFKDEVLRIVSKNYKRRKVISIHEQIAAEDGL